MAVRIIGCGNHARGTRLLSLAILRLGHPFAFAFRQLFWWGTCWELLSKLFRLFGFSGKDELIVLELDIETEFHHFDGCLDFLIHALQFSHFVHFARRLQFGLPIGNAEHLADLRKNLIVIDALPHLHSSVSNCDL